MRQIIYTDTDRIRSVLGVEDRDLSDGQITDRDLEKELRLDLLGWVPTHQIVYDAGQQETATEMEVAMADALVLYSTYYCAVLVSQTMQIAAPQSISDGKNALNRFNTIDWPALTLSLKERLASYRKFLTEQLTPQTSVSTLTLFSGVGLAVDPVTTASEF